MRRDLFTLFLHPVTQIKLFADYLKRLIDNLCRVLISPGLNSQVKEALLFGFQLDDHVPTLPVKQSCVNGNKSPPISVLLRMSILEDLRFGFRTLIKNPGFTAVAVTALALGIGVNATVFSLANAVLFKNLPFPNSDQILYIMSTNPTKPHWWSGFSYLDYLDLKGQLKSFDAVGASTQVSANISDHTASPESYRGARITANTFSLLGQKPIAGRDFTAADEQPGAAPVAILSYKVWQNRYGRDLSVIGRTVRIDEEPTTIIGVMPSKLDFPRETEVWKPLIPTDNYKKRENRPFTLYGHVAKGASIKSSTAEVGTVMKRISTEYPITNKDIGGRVIDYNEYFAGNESEIRIVFLAMLGAVGFVLLIACANVANLQLARAVSRMREISIRVALGAGRWRIVRQLLIESLMLSAAGGAIGLLLALWGIRGFDAAVAPTGKPESLDFTMDFRALLYFGAITIGTGLLFGLAPALRLSETRRQYRAQRWSPWVERRRTRQVFIGTPGRRRNGAGRRSARGRGAHDAQFHERLPLYAGNQFLQYPRHGD